MHRWNLIVDKSDHASLPLRLEIFICEIGALFSIAWGLFGATFMAGLEAAEWLIWVGAKSQAPPVSLPYPASAAIQPAN